MYAFTIKPMVVSILHQPLQLDKFLDYELRIGHGIYPFNWNHFQPQRPRNFKILKHLTPLLLHLANAEWVAVDSSMAISPLIIYIMK